MQHYKLKSKGVNCNSKRIFSCFNRFVLMKLLLLRHKLFSHRDETFFSQVGEKILTVMKQMKQPVSFPKTKEKRITCKSIRWADIGILYNDTTLSCHCHFFAYHSVYQLIAMSLLFFDHFIPMSNNYCLFSQKTE